MKMDKDVTIDSKNQQVTDLRKLGKAESYRVDNKEIATSKCAKK